MVTSINNEIKVTVIVPVFNVEKYINKCLDSIINQTLKEIEIILIDDCSTDKSGDICSEYAKKDSRIILIRNEKTLLQGPSRNIGIEIANGEYVGFVDPDDWVDLNFFEKLYNKAKTKDYDIVKTESIIVTLNAKKKKQSILNKRITTELKRGTPLFLLFEWEHTTAIYKSSILHKKKIKYPKIITGEDDLFLLNYTYYVHSISVISGVYYYYRQHSASITAVKEVPYFNSILECFKLKVIFLNEHKMLKQHYLKGFSNAYNSVFNRYKEFNKEMKNSDYYIEYYRNTIKILVKYKYDKSDLLEDFKIGFIGEKESNREMLGKTTLYLFRIFFSIKRVFRHLLTHNTNG